MTQLLHDFDIFTISLEDRGKRVAKGVPYFGDGCWAKVGKGSARDQGGETRPSA